MTHTPSESEMKALREIVAEHMASSSGRERTRAGKEDGAYNMNIAKAAFALGRERVLDVAHEIGCAQCALGEQRVSDGHVGYEHIIDGKHVPCTRKEPQPLSDGWIRYDGKGMPVSGDTEVWVKFHDGHVIDQALSADHWFWDKGKGKDIIAYRLDKPAKAGKVEAKPFGYVGPDTIVPVAPYAAQAPNITSREFEMKYPIDPSPPDPMSRPVTRGELVDALCQTNLECFGEVRSMADAFRFLASELQRLGGR